MKKKDLFFDNLSNSKKTKDRFKVGRWWEDETRVVGYMYLNRGREEGIKGHQRGHVGACRQVWANWVYVNFSWSKYSTTTSPFPMIEVKLLFGREETYCFITRKSNLRVLERKVCSLSGEPLFFFSFLIFCHRSRVF